MHQLNSCCGIGEIDGLAPSPLENLINVSDDSTRFNLIVFTDRVSFKHGSRLAAYIKRNKLGDITVSKTVKNVQPGHTNHKLKLWVWAPNWKALLKWNRAYYKKHPPIINLYHW